MGMARAGGGGLSHDAGKKLCCSNRVCVCVQGAHRERLRFGEQRGLEVSQLGAHLLTPLLELNLRRGGGGRERDGGTRTCVRVSRQET